MLMAGCVCVGASERGAFGFSNDKSFTYWPRTLSCAWLCCAWPSCAFGFCGGPPLPGVRSEEHTFELQSRPHLVCRLLLEKKKKLDGTRGTRKKTRKEKERREIEVMK